VASGGRQEEKQYSNSLNALQGIVANSSFAP
jgi:hypothetical protein